MTSPSQLLLKTLDRRDELSAPDRTLIEGIQWRIAEFATEQDIVSQGDMPTESCLLLDGYAGRAHVLEQGARQLSNFHVSGDFVDLHAFVLKVMDHSVTALAPSRVAFVRHDALHRITEASPHVARLLWMLTAIDAAVERAWIVSLGRRSTEAHFAHFLCEIFLRLQIVGLTDDHSFALPITRLQLADILGLSPVHVHRTVQKLRGDRLIEWKRHTISIIDWRGLVRLAEFDAGYLNLREAPR